MFPIFDNVEFGDIPYEHFVAPAAMPSRCLDCLAWLEEEAPWTLTTTEFYEQYEFSLRDVALPPYLQQLVCPDALASLRRQLCEQFGKHLSEGVDVTAHKLVCGQTIRIHNDFIPGGESHRLLLQLNRGWKPKHGGYLMLFSGPEPESVSKVIEPFNGSIHGFSISPQSYHAVSTVHSGQRFTIVYSFYPTEE